MRCARLLILLVAVACAEDPAPVESVAGDSERRPNVILLTIDTLRADHLSCYGYERPTSPNIDRFASQGVLFEHLIAQRGGTWPSLTSMLTSLYPRDHGVRSNGHQLDARIKTLSERLRRNGYTTAAFLCNMTTAPNRGYDVREYFKDPKTRDEEATTRTIAWLEQREGDDPFFLWLHLMGPHCPYTPPAPYDGLFTEPYDGDLNGTKDCLNEIHADERDLTDEELAYLVALYDGAIVQSDERTGRVLDAIDRLGLADDSLVILTSDHGEELYEHNKYFLHSWSIYDSVLRIPLIFRLPGVTPPGRTVDAIVESLDIAPTIFELVGLKIPRDFDGRSLAQDIRSSTTEDAASEAAVSELGPHIYSLRTDRWLYIYNPRGYSSPGDRRNDTGRLGYFRIQYEELYDVRADPAQQRNLARELPTVASDLRSQLVQWIDEGGDVEFQAPDIPSDALEELRALGYIK